MVNPAGAAQAAQAPPPIAVPPIAKFLDLPGEPPIPWRRWILQFENFWTMANAGQPEEALYTPQQKSRYLLLMLGAEGARLTADCPAVDQIDTLPHQTFVDALHSIFEPQRSPVRAIADFNRRYQGQGETVDEWMADLRALAVHCKFPDGQTDRMLAGQLATGCISDKARERLYLLAEINLERIREILATDEALRRELTDSSQQAVKALNRMGAPRGRQKGTRGASAQSSSPPCAGCGGTNHQRTNCSAKDLSCNTCGKTGHIAKVCRTQAAGTRGRGGRARGSNRGGRGTSSPPESTGAIFLPDAPQGTTMGAIHALDVAPRCWVEVEVWNRTSWGVVSMEADSGAAHRGSPGHSQDQGVVPRARSRCSTLHRPQQLLISHGEEPPGTPASHHTMRQWGGEGGASQPSGRLPQVVWSYHWDLPQLPPPHQAPGSGYTNGGRVAWGSNCQTQGRGGRDRQDDRARDLGTSEPLRMGPWSGHGPEEGGGASASLQT